MKNHEIDLKLLDEIMNKKPKLYKSLKKNKKDFTHKAVRIKKNHRLAPLMSQFRDIYYHTYEKMDISQGRFIRAVGEYLTNTCELKLCYRPGKTTIFGRHPSIKFPKNDDPILDIEEPILDQNEDQDEDAYKVVLIIKKTYFPEILEATIKKIGMTKKDKDLVNQQISASNQKNDDVDTNKSKGPMSKELVAFLKSNPNLEEYENVSTLSDHIDKHPQWVPRNYLLCAIKKWIKNATPPLKTGIMFERMMKLKKVSSDD